MICHDTIYGIICISSLYVKFIISNTIRYKILFPIKRIHYTILYIS